ncbi:MAG: hypothetical protein IJ906_02535, partial [Oscillospiraceae bacterium]|nr:hypothetical protein [Oscillospiraceae bacterium]
MHNKNAAPSRKNVIQQTLDSLTRRRKAPTAVFVILLILYLVACAVVSGFASYSKEVMIFGLPIPIYSFAGVFSVIS